MQIILKYRLLKLAIVGNFMNIYKNICIKKKIVRVCWSWECRCVSIFWKLNKESFTIFM